MVSNMSATNTFTCTGAAAWARAGVALATAGLGSFFAGSVATLILAAFATPLSELAFKFGPAEYFSLMVLGLIGAVVLASGSLPKAVAMIVLGLLMGLVGTDVNSGAARFSFDVPELTDGLNFVSVAMGVFGFAEIIANLEQKEARETFTDHVTNLFPTKEDFKRMIPAVLRGTALGSALGILPGGGAALASFAAYSLEKKTSKFAHEFGKGAIEGVAAPESANNAGAQTSFIPMLTLGIPGDAVTAIMIGALFIHGLNPGPMLMIEQPDMFWFILGALFVLILATGSLADGLFGVILVVNSLIGIVQELLAKRKLDRLALLNRPTAHVIRDGVTREIPIGDVVLGDLLELRTGDQVPAVGPVRASRGLELDESTLTGESDAVPKGAGDRVQSGTAVVAGSGTFVAAAVGPDAYANQIAAQVRKFTRVRSEIQSSINRLLKWIT